MKNNSNSLVKMVAIFIVIITVITTATSCSKKENFIKTDKLTTNPNITTATKSLEERVREAYNQKLDERTAQNENSFRDNRIYYVVYDIDHNGISELIIDNGQETKTASNGVEIYTYTEDNDLVFIGSLNNGHVKSVYDENSGDGNINIVFEDKTKFSVMEYSIENNTLTANTVTDWKEWTDDDRTWLYELSGKIEFESLLIEGRQDLPDGTCGEESYWKYYEEESVLHITGNGTVSYTEDWNEIKSTVQNIEIDDGIEVIAENCFSEFKAVKSITLPEEIKSIGKRAFFNTAYSNNSDNWINGSLYIGSCLIKVNSDTKGSYTVRDDVTLIADCAFDTCSVSEIVIPRTGNYYSYYYYGYDYKQINLSSKPFADCKTLKSVVFNGPQNISVTTFENSSNIESVKVNTDGMDEHEYSFYDKYFAECFKSTKWYNNNRVVIDGVTYVDFLITDVKEGLTGSCKIKDGVIWVDVELLRNTNITSLYLPESVVFLDPKFHVDSPCGLNPELESIAVNENNPVYSSDNGVLYNKDKSEIILYPENKKDEHFVVKDTVEFLDTVLYHNHYLKSVFIGAGVEYIDTGITSSGWIGEFYDCTSLEYIEVSANNKKYSSDEYGVLYNKNKTTLVYYPDGKKSKAFVVPDSVRIINDGAFYSSIYLRELYIGKNVEKIEGSDCFPVPEYERADGTIRSMDVYYAGSQESFKKIKEHYYDVDYIHYNVKNFPDITAATRPATTKKEVTTKKQDLFDWF